MNRNGRPRIVSQNNQHAPTVILSPPKDLPLPLINHYETLAATTKWLRFQIGY